MGTPEFAVPSLNACLDFDQGEVVAVFTQPDRPKGRGHKLTPPPIKVRAQEMQLPVYQPERIRSQEAVEALRALLPDLIVVVAYGQILSKEILKLPKYGCLNVHASLLPRLRGASPIQWSIASGEKTTGITTMQMDTGLDEGDILLQRSVAISETMTGGALHDVLMQMGAELLTQTLSACVNDTLKPEPQANEQATYAPKIEKSMAEIDWTRSAQEISAQLRGFDPWPACITTLGEIRVKLFQPEVLAADISTEAIPGTVTSVDRDGIVVATGQGLIRIKEIQSPGSRRMRFADYLSGHHVHIGDRLGPQEVMK
jgi:methionyl-tRNA formyltransferase